MTDFHRPRLSEYKAADCQITALPTERGRGRLTGPFNLKRTGPSTLQGVCGGHLAGPRPAALGSTAAKGPGKMKVPVSFPS